MSNELIEKVKRNQGAIIHWVIVVGISATIAAVIMLGLGVEKATYESDTARYEESLMLHGAGIADNDNRLDANDSRLDNIEGLGTLATLVELATVLNQTEEHDLLITAASDRLTIAEGQISDVLTSLATVTNETAANGINITALREWATNTTTDIADILVDLAAATNQITINGADITALEASAAALLTDLEALAIQLDGIEDDLLEAMASPPEGYLTGGFGNYTLHARASEAGNFTADVVLVYSTLIVVGNTTYNDAVQAFYGSVNLSAPSVRQYEPSLVYTSTEWVVRRVTFNIGTFALEAATEKSIAVVFGGLNSTYAPAFAYVYVAPVLQ